MAWAAAGSVFGGLMNYLGQEDANETNMAINQNNSAFNAEQAALNRTFNKDEASIARTFNQEEAFKNRSFQEDQIFKQQQFQQFNANTTYRRAIDDLKGAGLNPMLAYSQGGAPAPHGGAAGGSQASGQGASSSAAQAAHAIPMQNVYAAAGQTAAQWAQIENIQADTKKKEAEEELTRDQASTEKGRPANLAADTDRIRKQAELYVRQHGLTAAQTDKVAQEIQTELERTKNVSADTALKKVNEILGRHDIPRMKAEDLYFKTPIGKESPHNKYGPQNIFRLIEGLGERVINRWSAK